MDSGLLFTHDITCYVMAYVTTKVTARICADRQPHTSYQQVISLIRRIDMVALTYYSRLFRGTFFQFPQRFHAPSQPSDLSRKVFLVTGGT